MQVSTNGLALSHACVSRCGGHKEAATSEADAVAGATTFRTSFFAFD